MCDSRSVSVGVLSPEGLFGEDGDNFYSVSPRVLGRVDWMLYQIEVGIDYASVLRVENV